MGVQEHQLTDIQLFYLVSGLWLFPHVKAACNFSSTGLFSSLLVATIFRWESLRKQFKAPKAVCGRTSPNCFCFAETKYLPGLSLLLFLFFLPAFAHFQSQELGQGPISYLIIRLPWGGWKKMWWFQSLPLITPQQSFLKRCIHIMIITRYDHFSLRKS